MARISVQSWLCLLLLMIFVLSASWPAFGQSSLRVNVTSFRGVLHDNDSNRSRQGSGFTPLELKDFPNANLFRDEAVGLNFEHIFNGAKKQHAISMFTPRRDPCHFSGQVSNMST